MKRKLLVISLIVLLVSITAIAASAGGVEKIEPQDPRPVPEFGDELINETPDLWFVELPSKPTADGGSKVLAARDKVRFQRQANRAGLDYEVRFSFSTLWNGVSIKMDSSQLSALTRMSSVKTVYPVATIPVPATSGGITPDLFTAIQMTGADIAQNDLGYTGAGVRVAVMDTGIDYDHPDLGGCFGPGCRVETGWDFVGDDFDAGDDDPIIAPDDDPDDCQGHGTHVSGIVGANGVVTGVAPGVTFGAYRVFGCEGSTTADIMIAAMEMALADDMDILNMSIGSSFTWPQYPTGQASDRMVNKGMIVVASIGNSGADGTYSAGAPGLGKKVIGVASIDNVLVTVPNFVVAEQAVGYIPMTGSPAPPTSGTDDIIYVGRGCNVDLPLLADPSGMVALIERGACSFREKAINAIDAGATAVVVHNQNPGLFGGTVQTPPLSVPVVGIGLADGLHIRDQVQPAELTWKDDLLQLPNPTGGLISSFSSYGLSPDLALKPDISAPGGSIFSTIPLEQGGYGGKGGTSMSSPHVAGAAALILEAHPGTNSQVMRTILQNSADPVVWSLNPGLGFLDHVHRQGAGMVDIDDAILATTKVEPGKISVGESEAGPYNVTLKVENNGPDSVTYDLSHLAALSTGPGSLAWADPSGTYFPGFFTSDAVVDFAASSVTVPAGGSANVHATIHPATGPTNAQYGGYIVLTPQDGGQVYSVPYAGFVGDYQGIDPLFNIVGLPLLVESVDADFVYTMEGDDIPEFWVHLDHQARKLRMEVFNADTGRAWHRAYDEEFLPRNFAYNSFFGFPWDGETISGKRTHVVPDGDYFVKLSLQKALGDDNNPDHWSTWTSTVFTIERP